VNSKCALNLWPLGGVLPSIEAKEVKSTVFAVISRPSVFITASIGNHLYRMNDIIAYTIILFFSYLAHIFLAESADPLC